MFLSLFPTLPLSLKINKIFFFFKVGWETGSGKGWSPYILQGWEWAVRLEVTPWVEMQQTGPEVSSGRQNSNLRLLLSETHTNHAPCALQGRPCWAGPVPHSASMPGVNLFPLSRVLAGAGPS